MFSGNSRQMIAGYRQSHGQSWFAYSEGWRSLGTVLHSVNEPVNSDNDSLTMTAP